MIHSQAILMFYEQILAKIDVCDTHIFRRSMVEEQPGQSLAARQATFGQATPGVRAESISPNAILTSICNRRYNLNDCRRAACEVDGVAKARSSAIKNRLSRQAQKPTGLKCCNH
jgi:hypothetical protein